MTLDAIGEQYRVPVKRDGCGDPIIPGKNGHLYTEGRGVVMVCFTDDGRKKPFPTARFKNARLAKLQPWVKRIKLEGQYEFIAEIEPDGIKTALAILQVRRFMATKGVPPSPEKLAGLERGRQMWAQKRTEGAG